jgi:hypothetical protein
VSNFRNDPLYQAPSIIDEPQLEQLLRILTKADANVTFRPDDEPRKARKREKLLEKANKMQLKHYRATGRWLLGTPFDDGWYPDPARRYAIRFFHDGRWTERVRDANGAERTDPPGGATAIT